MCFAARTVGTDLSNDPFILSAVQHNLSTCLFVDSKGGTAEVARIPGLAFLGQFSAPRG